MKRSRGQLQERQPETSSTSSSSNPPSEYLANDTGERHNPKQQRKDNQWLKPKTQTTPRIGDDYQVSLPTFQPPPTTSSVSTVVTTAATTSSASTTSTSSTATGTTNTTNTTNTEQ
jgi:hypothetical protein